MFLLFLSKFFYLSGFLKRSFQGRKFRRVSVGFGKRKQTNVQFRI